LNSFETLILLKVNALKSLKLTFLKANRFLKNVFNFASLRLVLTRCNYSEVRNNDAVTAHTLKKLQCSRPVSVPISISASVSEAVYMLVTVFVSMSVLYLCSRSFVFLCSFSCCHFHFYVHFQVHVLVHAKWSCIMDM
jgi:hypothetical protein